MVPNIDPKTAIHFGVISNNSLHQEVLESEVEYICPPDCSEEDCCGCMLPQQVIDQVDLKAEYLEDFNCWIVLYSKWVRRCALCSPCFPNAGNCDEPDENGVETYCFPPNYF